MIVTARQLDDLHRLAGSNGHVVVPYRARLTPLAVDWIRAKKIALGYGDVPAATNGNVPVVQASAVTASPAPMMKAPSDIASSAVAAPAGGLLWWADGPCGPAKAAVIAMERDASLRASQLPHDRKFIVAAIRELAAEIKVGRASGGVLLVQNASAAGVFANRCPSLRAVVGTCLDAVEQGVRDVFANVLVIEHPQKTLPQVKNLLSRFVRGTRTPSDEVRRQLDELASCS